jgi:hypothetical protein
MLHDHAAGVAREPAGRFRGNVHPVLEDGLAGLRGVGQHRRIDVDHHLIAFARGSGIEPVVESGFREQRQRVRLVRENVECAGNGSAWQGPFLVGRLYTPNSEPPARLRDR